MAASQRILLGHVKGEKGDKGDAATIRVGGTNTVAPGTPASVTEGGTPNDRILTFNIPQGQPGAGGGGGAGANLRSTATPMVYRIPVNWPFAPNIVLGAMDTLGWHGPHNDYWTGRVLYFTNHATQGIVDGWQRTRRSPWMQNGFTIPGTEPPEVYDMWKLQDCPVNFGTLGYRGNWCRSEAWGTTGESLNNPYWLRRADFDGLALTSGNRALWMYGRGNLGRRLRYEAIDLPGLTSTPAITGMWAGVTPRSLGGSSRIWVIQNNRLYLCHVLHSSPRIVSGGVEIDPGTHRRITGGANFTFVEVSNGAGTGQLFADGALPTTMSRVYAEGAYAAVWGTAPTNRLAFFDGTQWYALTIPFGFSTTYVVNAVIIFPNGRLGLYNGSNGNYYVCDNPSAGASAVWQLRYRAPVHMLMTNGFNKGIPQWVPRNTNSTQVYCQFNGESDDGGKCYINPRGANVSMGWPSELYCSTSRSDIIPSPTAAHGYAYAWGTKESFVNLSDRNTIMSAAEYYTPVWPALPMPESFSPGIPNQMTDGTNRRIGPFTTRTITGDYQGRVLDIYVGIAQTVLT